MACHEIAALRLGLMNLLGDEDEAERAHEIEELGNALHRPGPIADLAQARDLQTLKSLYGSALAELTERVARAEADDPKLGYLRSLLILTKKVELELEGFANGLTRLNRNLDEIHDLMHEVFPAPPKDVAKV